MNDNDIIKALEYCLDESKSTCVGCSYYNNVYKSCVIKKDALDLINRQKAEIERLREGIKFERERVDAIPNLIKQTIKGFAKTLRARAFNDEQGFYIVLIDQITELEKEMIEEIKP